MVAAGITAISLTQAPQLLDSADKTSLHYIQQTERSANELYRQYAQAKGNSLLQPEMMLNGVKIEEGQVSSPLGHYCYNSNQLEKPVYACLASE